MSFEKIDKFIEITVKITNTNKYILFLIRNHENKGNSRKNNKSIWSLL